MSSRMNALVEKYAAIAECDDVVPVPVKAADLKFIFQEIRSLQDQMLYMKKYLQNTDCKRCPPVLEELHVSFG